MATIKEKYLDLDVNFLLDTNDEGDVSTLITTPSSNVEVMVKQAKVSLL